MSGEEAWCVVSFISHPKGVQWGWSQSSVWPLEFFHSNLGKLCLHGAHFVTGHTYAGTGLCPLVPAYKVIRGNCVLLISWQQFGEDLDMVSCPHTFGHIV